MPIYHYLCNSCQHEHQQQRAIEERESVCCPECGSRRQEIIIQATPGKIGHQDRMISDAETVAKYGRDWRETPESKRIMSGEAKRKYSDGAKK